MQQALDYTHKNKTTEIKQNCFQLLKDAGEYTLLPGIVKQRLIENRN